MSFRLRKPVLLAAVTLTLTISGCGATSSSVGRRAANSFTPVPTFTSPPPTPSPVPPPCTRATLSPGVAAQQGDLLLSPTFAAPVDTPDAFLFQLPSGTQLSPLRLPAPGAGGIFHGAPSGWPVSTIGTSNNVFVALCNSAALATHTLQGVKLRVTAFTPFSEQLNVWNYCEGYYARPAGIVPNSCDRGPVWGDASHQAFQATFPSQTGVGTTVSATGITPSGAVGTQDPLPILLPAGRALYLEIRVTLPSAPGTYTLAADLAADGTALPTLPGSGLLFAPIAHTWSAQACQSATMQASIPAATNPPSPYICPDN
jgi:hypothetical protein